jgi:hypothetical protein
MSWYQGAGKSLARPTSRCILFDGENTFDASLVIYINSTNNPLKDHISYSKRNVLDYYMAPRQLRRGYLGLRGTK